MQAGEQLVVLEIESTSTCDSGLEAEAELHWEQDKRAALSRCANLKHVFQRTARDCPDVTFLTLEVSFKGSTIQEAAQLVIKSFVMALRGSYLIWLGML